MQACSKPAAHDPNVVDPRSGELLDFGLEPTDVASGLLGRREVHGGPVVDADEVVRLAGSEELAVLDADEGGPAMAVGAAAREQGLVFEEGRRGTKNAGSEECEVEEDWQHLADLVGDGQDEDGTSKKMRRRQSLAKKTPHSNVNAPTETTKDGVDLGGVWSDGLATAPRDPTSSPTRGDPRPDPVGELTDGGSELVRRAQGRFRRKSTRRQNRR